VLDLEVIVVIVGMRTETKLFERNGVLLLLGLFFFLSLLVEIFFVVQNTANRRIRIRGNLNKVETQILCYCQPSVGSN